ncbi:RNA polymerase sigma factor [Chitinophaga silvatica]|nr:sigma-70 family RNA polymerase sigma factor [Chitinophaga silvatica]
MLNPLSEKELLQRLAEGDENAFAAIYKQYQPKLYLFIFPLTACSQQDADEVIQDIFFKIWMRRDTMLTVNNLQAYLFMMAKNRLRDWHRQQQAKNQLTATLQYHHPQQHEEVEHNTYFQEYSVIARKAIEMLPDQKKRIFAMRHEEGLSLDEIALQLNITKFGVKKQLYDAVKFVKKYLKTNADIDMPLLILLLFYFR